MKIASNPTERRQWNEQLLKWDDQMKIASNPAERRQLNEQLLKWDD